MAAIALPGSGEPLADEKDYRRDTKSFDVRRLATGERAGAASVRTNIDRFNSDNDLDTHGGGAGGGTFARRKSSGRIKRSSSVEQLKVKSLPTFHEAIEQGDSALVRHYVKHGKNTNKRTPEGLTPLHLAALGGDTSIIRYLLSHGASLSKEDYDGQTAVYHASLSGSVSALKMLVEKGASLSGKDSDGCNPLHRAVQSGDIECVKYLVRHGVHVNTASETMRTTPLHLACAQGNVEIVQYLIRKGAKVNAKDKQHATPLLKALAGGGGGGGGGDAVAVPGVAVAERSNGGDGIGGIGGAAKRSMVDLLAEGLDTLEAVGVAGVDGASAGGGGGGGAGRMEVAQMLLDAKADVHAADKKGNTALHLACMHDLPTLAATFIDAGVDINRLDKKGETALHRSCAFNNYGCAVLLLNADAELSFPDGGTSPLHYAAFNGYVDLVRVLLEHHASLTAVDREGATVLHKAAHEGHVKVVEMLIRAGADLSAKDSEGSTPMHKAAFEGRSKVVEMLLASGADVNARDTNEGTPLHNAAFRGHSECVRVLVANKAHVNSFDENGNTPLFMCARHGFQICASTLIEAGADCNAQNDRGMTPLHGSIGYPELLRYLVSKGANADIKDFSSRTPLFYACKKGIVESVHELILGGADADVEDNAGKRPLAYVDAEHADAITQASIDEFIAERETLQAEQRQREFATAVKLFNTKPKKGLSYLFENAVINETPEELAAFYLTPGLNKERLGEVLGEPDDFSLSVLAAYNECIPMKDVQFDTALRHYLTTFRLPGEAQKIDRIMESFAKRYTELNPELFKGNPDHAYLLAFAVVMLNTDHHSGKIKEKMTETQFINSLRGQEMTNEFLASIYQSVAQNEIKMNEAVHNTFGNAEMKGYLTKQGGRIKTWKRRFFILSDNCLYYFREEKDSEPMGIIPLENVEVRVNDKAHSKHVCFDIYNPNNETLKACKIENGVLTQGHHSSYTIGAPTAEERDRWMDAIKGNRLVNPFDLLKNQRLKRHASGDIASRGSSDGGSGGGGGAAGGDGGGGGLHSMLERINFPELNSLATMCAMAYKYKTAIRSTYGRDAVVENVDDEYMCFIVVNNDTRKQYIVIGGLVWNSVQKLRKSTSEFNGKTTKAQVFAAFNVERTAERLFKLAARHLVRDYGTVLTAHSIASAVALELGLHLHKASYTITKVTTFGQPCFVHESKLAAEVDFGAGSPASLVAAVGDKYGVLPLLRVIDMHDPMRYFFHGCRHTGPEVLLLGGEYYSYVGTPVADRNSEVRENRGAPLDDRTLGRHDIEYYLSRVKGKLRSSVKVHRSESTHYP